ncbi:secreted protein [Streptomyces viridochromogenes DSM 40736]|uniref:Secreted protein n=1 Tax=Streptomyces viridochromogenes (strain DSM 40736 / JCM 4977 / BCRC 1201 / Tue 494) TaxID=591159 RepID=D9X886_STRVT|nr:hypothetical protein [Streptomyces viridochromogenes]EFL34124.1 secreted protein [Streptomyces viridochromogenes DSM 40736]
MTTLALRAAGWGAALGAATVLCTGGLAHADGPAQDTTSPSAPPPSGNANDREVSAAVSRIKVTQESGPTGGKQGTLSSTDVNWEPPPCWYEPVMTPEQLKKFSETGDALGHVSPHASWGGKKLWTDHYRDGKDAYNYEDESMVTRKGYKDYNLGKDGYFWRGVARDQDSYDCERVMFWQDAGEIPDVPNAPTAETLADYAYNKVKVPDTKVELKPEAKSTVNLPTWVWLDKGTFKDVKVRAELPNTNLWAETTAKPVALHLQPGTEDAEVFPASGDCEINDDGSIGTPYTKGSANETPPCGIRYLRATDGTPYHLSASITWQITWEGSGGTGGDLPDGTFETTQDMNVQEIQSINR